MHLKNNNNKMIMGNNNQLVNKMAKLLLKRLQLKILLNPRQRNLKSSKLVDLYQVSIYNIKLCYISISFIRGYEIKGFYQYHTKNIEFILNIVDLYIYIFVCVGKTKGKGTFGKVKQGTHIITGEKVKQYINTL